MVREKIYHEAGAHTADAMTSRAGPAHPRRREGAGRARQALPARARPSTIRRRSRRSAAARRCRWCTPHEARPDSVDQLLSGLRRHRSGPGAADGGAGRGYRLRAERPARRRRARGERGLGGRVRAQRGALSSAARPRDHLRRPGAQRGALLQRPVDGARRPHGAGQPPRRAPRLLLELLCRHRWGVRPRFATARAEARRSRTRSPGCRTTRCSSSATRRCMLAAQAALSGSRRPRRRVEGVDRAAVRVRGLGGAAGCRLGARCGRCIGG